MRRCDGRADARLSPAGCGPLQPCGSECRCLSPALFTFSLPVNALSSLLAAVTLTSYLLVYTPLKRKTPLCTFVGAVPGAMPTLIGWAAASDSISNGKAWILYAVLFLWQFPHFMAIAWMYREDYARAGYLIFPTNSEEN